MNLILFGSLLHPKELAKHDITTDMIKYVKVNGYKRLFNQEPSWRKVDSDSRAVMNVQADQSAWFNAIAVLDLPKEHFARLDDRERGYDRTALVDGAVVDYDGEVLKDCIVYVGKKGKQNSAIQPNKEYFKLCLDGAKSHFKQFGDDYVDTTFYYKGGILKKI